MTGRRRALPDGETTGCLGSFPDRGKVTGYTDQRRAHPLKGDRLRFGLRSPGLPAGDGLSFNRDL